MARRLALLSFLAAAALLACVGLLTWQHAIVPHVELVRRVPVEAIVVGHRIDDVGAGSQGCSYPRVLYRYEVDGYEFESTVVRHQNFMAADGEEAGGEIRFYGQDRDDCARKFLEAYSIGQRLKAWINSRSPSDAMLVRQELEKSPFLIGLLPALFVPFVWTFFMCGLSNWVGSPPGRWIALGWAVLTLTGFGPVCWQYRELLDPFERTQFIRLQDFGFGLAGIILVGSLLPRPFRGGLAVGLILSFTIVGGVAVASAAFIGQFQPVFSWKITPGEVLVRSTEIALLGGVALGLLMGLCNLRGIVTIRAMSEINHFAEPNAVPDHVGSSTFRES